MLQIERVKDEQEALRAILAGWQAKLWTALPGTVQSYNSAKGTCVVQPSVQALVTSADGTQSDVNLPLLLDVPVNYMGGGGMVATFPIQAGDEALVVFSSRCIDAWWQSGGVQKQAELRMHDLSDGFAFVGPRSLANSIPAVSTSTAQFRSLDGSTYVEIAAGQVVNIKAPAGLNITGNVTVTGTITATKEITATQAVTEHLIPLTAHLHGSPSAPTVPITGEPIP